MNKTSQEAIEKICDLFETTNTVEMFREKLAAYLTRFDAPTAGDRWICIHCQEMFIGKECPSCGRSAEKPAPQNAAGDNWISVEKPPREREKVLAINEFRYIRQVDWEEYTNQDLNWFQLSFTHWLPLSALPSPPTATAEQLPHEKAGYPNVKEYFNDIANGRDAAEQDKK